MFGRWSGSNRPRAEAHHRFTVVLSTALLVAALALPSSVTKARVGSPSIVDHSQGLFRSVSYDAADLFMPAGARGPEKARTKGGRRWTFNPGPGRDTEVSLAVDPRDPDRVLVAWQEDIRRIWAARTNNAGRTWRVEELRDPAGPPLGTSQEGFDPTAAIGPDGTMYVAFGGVATPAPGLGTAGGITLARTKGGGWSFHHVDDLGPPHLWDAMHLAVAPDSGALYVVAQSIVHRGIGFWKSVDRGDSWSVLRFPQAENPESAAQTSSDGFNYWPRIAAGPKGLVLLHTKAASSNGDQIRATLSLDGGENWGPVAPLTDEALPERLVGVPGAFDGSLAVAGHATTSGLVILKAHKATGPWQLKRVPVPEAMRARSVPDWSTVAARRGDIWILHTREGADPRWQVLLTRMRGTTVKTTVLTESTRAKPRGTSAGDEYGGLGIAPDGSVWAAWSQPTGAGTPVIAVARLPKK